MFKEKMREWANEVKERKVAQVSCNKCGHDNHIPIKSDSDNWEKAKYPCSTCGSVLNKRNASFGKVTKIKMM